MANKPPAAGRGRPKGAKNKVSVEMKDISRRMLSSAAYRAKLVKRLESGKIAPAVECMLYHYAYGKPIEQHEHSGPGGVPLAASTFILSERAGA